MSENEASITIKIKAEDGKETPFIVKKIALLSDVFKDYCKQKGLEEDMFQLKFHGSPINYKHSTLERLGMVDNDVVEFTEAMASITVRAEGGEVTKYEVKKSILLSEVFNTYAQDKGIEISSMQLVYKRKVLDVTQRVGDLGYSWQNEYTISCYLPQTNARHHIEELLATETSPGMYSTGSEITGVPVPSVAIILQNENGDMTGQKKLSFPLDESGIADIKDNAARAGVGIAERTVVNLDVRKTWQIKPQNLNVSDVEPALETALQKVSRDFGLDGDYKIEASLYKLLLYEPGCFFLRHRDNERLDGMFATLVVELPSEYAGAELSVHSPSTPDEKTTYMFNGTSSNTRPKRRTRSSAPGLHFAAFYADCYHEVSKLTSGHRVALVYHLTAAPNAGNQRSLYCGVTNQWRKGAGTHLPAISPTPPQPVDESIKRRLSKLVQMFAREGDEAYPPEDQLGKPKKLAIVLSHHYTPASFTSIHALKGSDRSIAELICAAAFCSPDGAEVPTLARLAAKELLAVGGEEYATNEEYIQANDLVREAFEEQNESNGPFFDAAISLANVWDSGEITPGEWEFERETTTSTFETTGPLISITGEGLDLGPKLPQDRSANWHPSLFGGQDSEGPPFQFESPPFFSHMHQGGPIVYGQQIAYRCESGNHTLPIFSHELLLTSEESRISFRKESYKGKHVVVTDPEDVEFLGNGGVYMGRIYSRAVILIWPKAHRKDVQMQSNGGKAIIANAGGK